MHFYILVVLNTNRGEWIGGLVTSGRRKMYTLSDWSGLTCLTRSVGRWWYVVADTVFSFDVDSRGRGLQDAELYQERGLEGRRIRGKWRNLMWPLLSRYAWPTVRDIVSLIHKDLQDFGTKELEWMQLTCETYLIYVTVSRIVGVGHFFITVRLFEPVRLHT